jgi:fumarate hydratase class II
MLSNGAEFSASKSFTDAAADKIAAKTTEDKFGFMVWQTGSD